MEQITSFIESVKALQIVDIVIAVCVIILFKVLSPSISYMIIKLFKFNSKGKKAIRESAFYTPLKVFFTILGIYLAILFLKEPLNLQEDVMNIVTKAFQIISVFAFAKALASSFTTKSSLIKRFKNSSKNNLDDSMLEFALKVARVIIYIIALFVVLAILQINLSGLVAGLGIGGIIVTLAAQDTAKNIFGGVVLFIDKPFNVGDWIQTPNYEGAVEDITFRTTRIRNADNAIVNIPNSTIADSAIINWSKLEKRRYKFNISLPLEMTSEKIELISNRIKEMLIAEPNVIDSDILISFEKIENSGLSLFVQIYMNITNYKDYMLLKDKLNKNIINILHNLGADLTYPTTSVYIEKQ